LPIVLVQFKTFRTQMGGTTWTLRATLRTLFPEECYQHYCSRPYGGKVPLSSHKRCLIGMSKGYYQIKSYQNRKGRQQLFLSSKTRRGYSTSIQASIGWFMNIFYVSSIIVIPVNQNSRKDYRGEKSTQPCAHWLK